MTDVSMTDFEKAVKVIDELISFFPLYQNREEIIKGVDFMDYNCVDDGIQLIIEARRRNPSFPVTLALAQYIEMTYKDKKCDQGNKDLRRY